MAAALPAGASAAPSETNWNIDPTLESSYEETRLATNGEDGFACYRIPALATATDGTVLASWDGRPGGCGDSPNPNSIVLRTASDDGVTWSEPRVIAAGVIGANQVGYSDPSFVVDRETGEIFNFFVKSYDWGWHQGGGNPPAHDRQVMHAVCISSTDNGQTWSEPVEVTSALDPGGEGKVYSGRFAASGQGIQLQYGEHAGRLIQQYTVRDITRGNGMYAVSLYSDDHGETWQAGEPTGPGMDENKVVELSDGTVMLNSCSSVGGGFRWVALSEDGGETYTEPVKDYQLIDPANNASIIRAYPTAAEGSAQAKILLFSNAAATSRSNGTITVSFDDGQTWTDRKVFAPGGMSYSTLATLKDGSIGLLFEPGGSNIQFAKFTWAWLDAMGVTISADEALLHRGDNEVEVTIGRATVTEETPAGTLILSSGGEIAPVEVDVPAIPVGSEVTVTLPVEVGQYVDAGPVAATFRYEAGDAARNIDLSLEVELKEGEYPSEKLPQSNFTALDYSTPQGGEGPERMFDGAIGTPYHTAYNLEVVPGGFTVDLGEVADLAYIDITPRNVGVNGTIGEYRILLGETVADLTEYVAGTWPASSDMRRVYVDGTSAQFVRVEALSSYGDTANKWLSVAEFNARTLGEAPVEPLLDISFDLVDTSQMKYAVGETIEVSTSVTNPTEQKLDAIPRAGNWTTFFPSCRYVGMNPGYSYNCTAVYTVTETDLLRGFVDLQQTWAVDDKNINMKPGIDPLQEFVVEGPRVNLGIHGVNAGATNVPDQIEVGTQLNYTFEFHNGTKATVAMVPLEGDFSGFHITGTPNCRYGALTPSDTPKTCNTAVYTVTEEDMAAGVVAPKAKFAVGPNLSGEDPYFILEVEAPAIEFDPVVEEPVTIVSVDSVGDVSVPFGTDLAGAKAALASETTVTDSEGGEHAVALTWVIADYDGDVAGDYTATGTFALPDGVEQAEPAVDLEVEATVTVLEEGEEPGEPGEPSERASLTLSETSVPQGGQLTVRGEGVEAGSTVELRLHSNPVKLGTTLAGADGTFQTVLTIPADTPVGDHRIEARTESGSVWADLQITASDPTDGGQQSGSTGAPQSGENATGTQDIPVTGSNAGVMVLASVILLFMGATLVRIYRRNA